MRFAFLLAASASLVVGRRGMTGLCRGSTLANMSPDTAARVLYGIDSGCALPYSVECVQGVISRVWAARPVARLTEQVREVRMSIPPIMLDSLNEYARSEGEARDVGEIWAEYLHAHPETRSSCHTLASWYHVDTELAGKLDAATDEASVRLRLELLGKMMYLELRQSANIRFYPEPTNSEIYSGFERDLEISVARKGVREDGFRNFQDIAPYVVWSIGRPLKFLDPSKMGLVYSLEEPPAAKSYISTYALQSWRQIVTRPVWLDAARAARVPFTKARYYVAREVLQGEFPDIVPFGLKRNPSPGHGRTTLDRATRLLIDRIGVPVVQFNQLMQMGMEGDTRPPEVTPEVADWFRAVLMPHVGKTIGSIGLVMFYWEHKAYVFPPRSIMNQIIRSAYPGLETGVRIDDATPVALPQKKQKPTDPLDVLAELATQILEPAHL